ncbi:MAG TPA: (Fe-S)-binding protein [Gemmatimonadales bacterium]
MAADAGRGGFEALDSCVHCGFCLQACPTFLVTGDEADSPRGRIELMRSLEAGRLPPDDPDLARHLDRCLGCRGCEPVCPSGVGYGHGLEAARTVLARARGIPFVARAALWALTTPVVSRLVYALARVARASRVPAWLAGWGRVRFALGMLAATRPVRTAERGMRNGSRHVDSALRIRHAALTPVLLFRGCVMNGLFSHVHDATIRTLEVNGYAVREVANQVCCGALHAHAGLVDEARGLARANVAAFADGEGLIATNSAGCGALLKDYGALLHGEPSAAAIGARVRDVTELLAERGPVAGAPLDIRVAYDPPCHLLHAQRVAEAPLRVLGAIPVLRLSTTPSAAQCCGSAGLFTLVEPEMSRAVLEPKMDELRTAAPEVVATGNPGCAMQLGAGLRAAGIGATTRHPVELLDASYRAAGLYA